VSHTRSTARRDAELAPRERRKGRRSEPYRWGRVILVIVLAGLVGVALWQAGLIRSQAIPPVTMTPAPAATATPDAREHRWVGRPLSRSAPRDFADRTYLFGSSKNNAYRVHHGLDLVNPTGTPVQAVADGTVVFAGSDSGTSYGPKTIANFYGNLVLIKLPRPLQGKDVYTLYGHFDSIAVKAGQQVKQGDLIGKIGMTGTADGPHLHLEVRVGGTTYANSRNPALWLQNLAGTGALAGKISDRAGKPAGGVLVTLMKDITVSGVQKYWGDVSTYPADPLGQLNPDEVWGENFAVCDLPVGIYEVRSNLNGQIYVRHVTIADGQTTWLAVQEGSNSE
jgi:hypothetical protein